MAGETFPNTYFTPAYFPSGHFGAQQTQAPAPPAAAAQTVDRGYAMGGVVRRPRRRHYRKTHPMQIVAAILAAEEQRRAKTRRG